MLGMHPCSEWAVEHNKVGDRCLACVREQAVYLHELLNKTEELQPSWGICGVGLMPNDIRMAEALRDQNFLYTCLELSDSASADGNDSAPSSRATIVGSIMDYIFVPADPAAAVKRMAAPEVKIVSLTVTEKGYGIGVDGNYELTSETSQAELPPGAPPLSLMGLLTAALLARRAAGVPPFAVLSCDNLPDNGATTCRALLDFVRAKEAAGDPAAALLAADLVAGRVAFPATMVDRITPNTEDSHREQLTREHGIIDRWPVVCEHFRRQIFKAEPHPRPPVATGTSGVLSRLRTL